MPLLARQNATNATNVGHRSSQWLSTPAAPGAAKTSTFFVFNTRRAIFSDIRVREAISLLFDFEWINHSYFFDLYRRTAGYFDGSELSSRGRPADERERALLAPFADNGVSMSRLESRPARGFGGSRWEYVFYIDIEGHRSQPEATRALEELRSRAGFVKILGSYPRAAY